MLRCCDGWTMKNGSDQNQKGEKKKQDELIEVDYNDAPVLIGVTTEVLTCRR